MNREIIDKIREAKKLEGEALMLLIPEHMRGHVKVIEKEFKAMMLECITECISGRGGQNSEKEASKNKVNKVDIE